MEEEEEEEIGRKRSRTKLRKMAEEMIEKKKR